MKNVFKFMFAVLAILLSLSSCRMYKRKAFAWGVEELKKQLPKEVAGKDFVVFDINVNVDTVEMSYKMSEKMWADFKQWEEIQNPDIIKAKLLSTASNDAIGIFVDDGMGLKYLIYSSETNKKLMEVCVSPDKLKEIYTKKKNGEYSALFFVKEELAKKKLPVQIEEGCCITEAYVKGGKIYYVAQIDSEMDPKEITSDYLEILKGVCVYSLRGEKVLVLNKQELMDENIHIIYILKNSRNIEYARVDIEPSDLLLLQ